MIIMLHSSRIRHNRDKGANVQQGPVQRFLFRLRPCVHLFIVSCCLHIPWVLYPQRILPLLALRHDRLTHVPGNIGFIMNGHPSAHFFAIKSEYLRECSASQVWPYMHQLRIMSLVKCWVSPTPGFAALRSVIIG